MSKSVLRWSELIIDSCQRHGVPPSLVAAIVDAESGGNSEAVSPVGAQGLMQLMPGTAASLGVTDPFDPTQNIDAGVRYLASAHRQFGDWTLAVASYNAGTGAVAQYGGIPPYEETQRYVGTVQAAVLRYLDLDGRLIWCSDAERAQYAPTFGTFQEAFANVLGTAKLLSDRIRRFRAENADVT